MLDKYSLPIGLRNNKQEVNSVKHHLNEFNHLFDQQAYKHSFLEKLVLSNVDIDKNNKRNTRKNINQSKNKKNKTAKGIIIL